MTLRGERTTDRGTDVAAAAGDEGTSTPRLIRWGGAHVNILAHPPAGGGERAAVISGIISATPLRRACP